MSGEPVSSRWKEWLPHCRKSICDFPDGPRIKYPPAKKRTTTDACVPRAHALQQGGSSCLPKLKQSPRAATKTQGNQK